VVVRSDQVLGVLDLLMTSAVTVWVDGGWGVDALIGYQTRDHRDLDLVIDANGLGAATRLLQEEGFEVVRDWLPTAVALAHRDGREVDLHPVELTGDGGGDQVQRDGVSRWHYDSSVMGRIGGRAVPCCSLSSQVGSHLGYEPDGDDFADMRALAQRFGLALPPPYGSAPQLP
jgi:lincosamide nucleotidyltransferase A/C/D/E